MSTSLRVTLSFLFLAVVFLVLNVVNFPTHTLLGAEIENLGHIPLFGVLSVAVLTLSQTFLARRLHHPLAYYVVAFVVTVGIGALTEFIQYFEVRDADFSDLVRDTIGAATFLAVYMTFDPRLAPFWGEIGSRVRLLVRWLAIAGLVAAAVPLGLWIASYLHRDQAFPVLFSSDSYWFRKFLVVQDADLSIVPAPEGWNALSGKEVGRLILRPAQFPGITIEEPFPDWTGYHTLELSLYLDQPQPVDLGLRIDDVHHNFDYRDRYTEKIGVAPGPNTLLIPLERVRMAPLSRETDMARISAVWLFAGNPKMPITIYIDRLKLE